MSSYLRSGNRAMAWLKTSPSYRLLEATEPAPRRGIARRYNSDQPNEEVHQPAILCGSAWDGASSTYVQLLFRATGPRPAPHEDPTHPHCRTAIATSHTISTRPTAGRLKFWKHDSLLLLILTLAIGIADFAGFIGAEEQNLAQPFVGINLGR